MSLARRPRSHGGFLGRWQAPLVTCFSLELNHILRREPNRRRRALLAFEEKQSETPHLAVQIFPIRKTLCFLRYLLFKFLTPSPDKKWKIKRNIIQSLREHRALRARFSHCGSNEKDSGTDTFPERGTAQLLRILIVWRPNAFLPIRCDLLEMSNVPGVNVLRLHFAGSG